MRTVAYLRVSTTEQTVENQRLAIEYYAKAREMTITKWYADEGISGTKDDRPSLNRLKADVASGKINVVIVWKFDRMARSTTHLLQTLSLFQQNECDFVSVSEAIDTTSAAGRMILTFLAAVAEFEVAVLRERIKLGIQRAKSQGIHCGRPRCEVDMDEIMRLRHTDKLSIRQIAVKVGVSYGTVQRALANSKYVPPSQLNAVRAASQFIEIFFLDSIPKTAI